MADSLYTLSDVEEGMADSLFSESDVEEGFLKVPVSKVTSGFKAKLHPRYHALLQEGKEWAEARIAPVLPKVAMEKLHSSKCVELACYICPNAEGRRASTLVKCWYWIVMFDDVADDPLGDGGDTERLRRFCDYLLQALFGGGGEDEDGHSKSSDLSEEELLVVELGREWWGEMTQAGAETEAPPGLQARIAEAVTVYVMEQLRMVKLRSEWEVWLRLRCTGPMPCSLEQLVEVLRIQSGAYLVLVLSEYDLGIELAEEALARPAMQQLKDAVSDHLCWVNNIFSFPKDMQKHETLNFLIPLHAADRATIARPFSATLTQAWNVVARLEDECADLSVLISNQEPAAQKYAHALCAVAGANFRWHQITGRYPMPSTK